jgi:hypothetical protein
MNAYKHGFTGQTLMVQADEKEAYDRLTAALESELQPATEQERQLVQKIVDGHTRLNRLAAVESNVFNLSLLDWTENNRTPVAIAQGCAWIYQGESLVRLSRYETRIARELLQFTKELERLQSIRISRSEKTSQTIETKSDTPDLALFGKNAGQREAA